MVNSVHMTATPVIDKEGTANLRAGESIMGAPHIRGLTAHIEAYPHCTPATPRSPTLP